MVNLVCCGGRFSNKTFIDAKTKYRSLYLLDVSQPYLQNHIRTSLGYPQDVSRRRPQDICRTLLLELSFSLYGKVLITSAGHVLKTSVEDVLRTLIRDVPLRCIENHTGTSIARRLGMCSERPRDVILPSGYLEICALELLFCRFSCYNLPYFSCQAVYFHNQKVKTKTWYLEIENSFKVKQKVFFHHFKGFSVATNCLRPETWYI